MLWFLGLLLSINFMTELLHWIYLGKLILFCFVFNSCLYSASKCPWFRSSSYIDGLSAQPLEIFHILFLSQLCPISFSQVAFIHSHFSRSQSATTQARAQFSSEYEWRNPDTATFILARVWLWSPSTHEVLLVPTAQVYDNSPQSYFCCCSKTRKPVACGTSTLFHSLSTAAPWTLPLKYFANMLCICCVSRVGK